MDISTLTTDKQVKLQYWLDVIRHCGASGLTNQVWCEQHDIFLKSYYYWIAKIRKLALEELSRKNHGCRPVMELAVLAPDVASDFADEFIELFLFFKAFQATYSELICIFPCFCPYGQFTRESFF